MIDVNAYVYKLLSTDATILSIVGTTSHVFFGYPNSFQVLPIVSFYELNQGTSLSKDNQPAVWETFFQIDVWTNNAGTTALAQAVDNVMTSNFFDCEYSSDTPEPDSKLRHRVLRYRRQLTAEDLN